MNDTNNLPLDYFAAQHAQEIIKTLSADSKKAKELENSLTKTLGVLQEHGVYACFLYLYAREKEIGETTVAHLLNLLKSLGLGEPQNQQQENVLLWLQNLTGNLPRLLLAREALEQMLIYARYGAKARQKEK